MTLEQKVQYDVVGSQRAVENEWRVNAWRLANQYIL